MRPLLLFTTWAFCLAFVFGCESSSEKSALEAKAHVVELRKLAREDVREIRDGLPAGAREVEKLFGERELNAETAREVLSTARNKVQDLRTAKSTFFALARADGVIVRNDQEQDRMAQKGLFAAFPALRTALEGHYVEARGSMPEAAEIRGRPDAQWVAASPIRVGGAKAPNALYVTGWSWSAYAYRLQNSLRSSVASARKERDKMPLLYVFVVVDNQGYGARDAPDVNVRAVMDTKPLERAKGEEPVSSELEITGRAFGLGVALVPELGERVALAVLRSET